jgi:hypothetical protein
MTTTIVVDFEQAKESVVMSAENDLLTLTKVRALVRWACARVFGNGFADVYFEGALFWR